MGVGDVEDTVGAYKRVGRGGEPQTSAAAIPASHSAFQPNVTALTFCSSWLLTVSQPPSTRQRTDDRVSSGGTGQRRRDLRIFGRRRHRDSMKAIRGVLLTCDSAVKQILLTMNEKESFIIEDLDDHHVVIKADEEWRVRRDLEAELEKNTYSLE
ncbi:Tbf5-domain-containing protein [Obba rivulosa]|uniref:General transcription and DNA repair factor IIH subunit TFB5 n=1 Tax=Obba rivulosa TaxID=1052685 RepID=A0A8E2AWN9_9APHY|nr:Tbf5-domain-containing protein [Obba rivulosa]